MLSLHPVPDPGSRRCSGWRGWFPSDGCVGSPAPPRMWGHSLFWEQRQEILARRAGPRVLAAPALPGDVLQRPAGGEAAVRGGAGAPDPCPVLLGAWASGCPSTPGQGWLSPSLLPDPPRLLRDAGRSGAALRPFPSWGDGGRCCAQGRGERVRSEEQPEESSPGPDPLCCIPQRRDTLQGDRLSSSPACYLWGN